MKKVGLCFPFDPFVTHSPFQSETFSAPNAQQAAKGAQSIASYHGYSGPVQVTYPDLMYGGPQQPAFVNTIVGLTGIKHYKDLNGGTPNCVSITPNVRMCFFFASDGNLRAVFHRPSTGTTTTTDQALQLHILHPLKASGQTGSPSHRTP